MVTGVGARLCAVLRRRTAIIAAATCSLEHEEEDQAGHGNRDRDALASRPRSKHEQYQGNSG